jgi:hypothetical protein
MTPLTRLPLAAIFLAAGLTAAAAQDTSGHEAHHPTGATSPAADVAAPTQPGSAGAVMPMGKAGGGVPMPDTNGMMGAGMGQMMGMMGGMAPFAHTEGRIAFLKTELAITDAQLRNGTLSPTRCAPARKPCARRW